MSDEERTDHQMPVVGGTKHGEVLTVPAGRREVLYLDSREMPLISWMAAATPIDETNSMPKPRVLNVQRFCCIMPGRTDQQVFPLLVSPGQDNSALAWHAILIAWKNGWSPPETTSEYQPMWWESALSHARAGLDG